LTWKYLFNGHVPKFVKLLSLYDTWNHNNGEFDWEFIERFQYGFKARSRDPKDDMPFWENCFSRASKMNKEEQFDDVRFIAENGLLIKSYVEDRYRSEISTRSYKIDWEGYKCLVINSDPYIANFMTRSKEFEGCDIAVNYANKKGESWIANLRTLRDDIDLSVLAKKYGGGGHRAASGFNWKSWILPWDLEV
jgi:oligoribonuclease NrnB/cAMP/cGMP phosphodiesterase (DHH superfamily)